MTRPRLFRELTYEAARAAATSEGKLLLVDVMGDWCMPCRMMDQTTWRAPEVETWVSANAVAIQVDSKDASMTAFEIRAVPTMMLFRGDELLDRITGARSASDLVGWLERAKRGEKEVRKPFDPDDPLEPGDIHGRHRRVGALMKLGRLDEATDELASIWEHALDFGARWFGVRHSYVVATITELVAAHPKARERFAAIRDRNESELPEKAALRDWVILDIALGEEERVLAWSERAIAGSINVVEHLHLFDLMVRHQRWAELGRLIVEPERIVERMHGPFDAMVERMGTEVVEHLRAMWRTQASCVVRALRTAGREAEAAASAARAKELDPSPAMKAALESDRPPAEILPRARR